MLNFIRSFGARGFAISEHSCSIAFAGLEFTNRIHLVLTISSALLLACLVIVTLDHAFRHLTKMKG